METRDLLASSQPPYVYSDRHRFDLIVTLFLTPWAYYGMALLKHNSHISKQSERRLYMHKPTRSVHHVEQRFKHIAG